MADAGPTILFVYNAESGIVSGLIDSIHKVISPKTYPCDLCAITHGPLVMRRAWRDYLKALPLPARFLHRAEFLRQWRDADVRLPAILLARDGALAILVGAAAMQSIDDVGGLIAALDAALAISPSSA